MYPEKGAGPPNILKPFCVISEVQNYAQVNANLILAQAEGDCAENWWRQEAPEFKIGYRVSAFPPYRGTDQD